MFPKLQFPELLLLGKDLSIVDKQTTLVDIDGRMYKANHLIVLNYDVTKFNVSANFE